MEDEIKNTIYNYYLNHGYPYEYAVGASFVIWHDTKRDQEKKVRNFMKLPKELKDELFKISMKYYSQREEGEKE